MTPAKKFELFLEDMSREYGFLAHVCGAMVTIAFGILTAMAAFYTYGLVLLIFPIGFAYMAYKTYKARYKQ